MSQSRDSRGCVARPYRAHHHHCEQQRTDGCEQALITETENLLEKWKHPDPYRPPTAPGGMQLYSPGYVSGYGRGNGNADIYTGSKYERNLPVPILDRKCSSSAHD